MAELWLETGTAPDPGGLLDQDPYLLRAVVAVLTHRARAVQAAQARRR